VRRSATRCHLGRYSCHMSPPPGSGGEPRSVAVSSAGFTSTPLVFLVQYGMRGYVILPRSHHFHHSHLLIAASPTITALLPSPGGACRSVGPLTLIDCNRLGSDVITLRGNNFGPTGARVLTGLELCSNPTFTVPHRELFCHLLSGTGQRQAVVLLQAAGDLSRSNATFSYESCSV
jgi:hypothetical protein